MQKFFPGLKMDERKVGVYICHCGTNIGGVVDVNEVAEFAKRLDSVVVARHYKYMCSDPGQSLIQEDIKKYGLNRVVVASCSPRMHEPTFRRTCQDAGLNPYLLEMANIREHCSWVTQDHEKATEKAKALVQGAVRRVFHHQPLEKREIPVNPNTLVVGGGIAGIQAALQIANSNHKVYLVEREPSIGGHMIQLDKTFPTLDCSACILTPKMSDVGHHPNIELMSYSEIIEASGSVGNFQVKVRKKARYVDESKCVGCRLCEEKCPRRMYNEFEMGLTERGAAYISCPQAIPNIATIDKREERPCKAACKEACPIHMNVLGYISLIAEGKFKEAYELIRRTNPLPAACGRVCYAPCEDACNRGQIDEPIAIKALKRFIADYELKVGREKAAPVERTREEKVAIVGSGPAGLACAYDLVRQGYSVTVFESAPEAGGLLRYGIPEYRLPKEVLSNEISYIQELGVEIKTNTPANNLTEIFNQGYKAIFLGTGAGVSQKMGILGEDIPGVLHALNFLRQANSGAKVSLGSKVAVIGGGNAAVDTARVARRLGVNEITVVYRRSRTEMPAIPSEIEEMEREGIKIHFLAAPVKVLSKDNQVTGIECIRMALDVPDASGRRRPVPVKGSEFTIEADNVIIAIGQGLDKAMLPKDLAYTDWGTLSVDSVTLQTNIDGVFAGGDVVSGPADVITAIAAGKKAAYSIDKYLKGEKLSSEEGKKVQKLSEEEVAKIKERFTSQDRVKASKLEPEARVSGFEEVEQVYSVDEAQDEAGRCLASRIEGCIECGECEEWCDAKAINFNQQDQILELGVGSIILSTGYDQFDPIVMAEYGYKKYDNVLTGLEFERMVNASGPTGGQILLKDGREPKSVGIIHCVGSRDVNYHEYCSRVCCMYALKFSHLLREHIPGVEIYQCYIDMRCFGKSYEEFYNRLLEEGVNFVRGRVGEVSNVAETAEEKGKLIMQVEDTLIGQQRRIPVDIVILCCAVEPRSDSDEIARLFRINKSADGFFLERHPKLDPVATFSDGIYVVGCCQGPKDIPDTVAQASAAAAQVLSMLSKGVVEIEVATAVVDEESCSGCKICYNLCPYSAISFDGEKAICQVNEVLCKGCGVCGAACPSGAITNRHSTTEEIMSQIEGVLV
jgi:heterodisulfide reductase subunit A